MGRSAGKERRFGGSTRILRRVVPVVAVIAASLVPTAPAASAVTIRDLSTAPAEFVAYGSKARDRLGLSLAVIGDIDGDGIPDIALGAPLDDLPGGLEFNNGAVHVYFGSSTLSGSRDAALAGSPDLIIYGESGGATDTSRTGVDNLGKGVAMGDVNGDGKDDLIVSAIRHSLDATTQDRKGKVYVFYQDTPPSWPAVIDLSADPTQADVTILGDVRGGDLGMHLAAPDLNGDGIADMVAGAGAILAASIKPGGVRVVYGSSSLPSTIDLAAPPAGVRTFFVNGAAVGDKLGHGVAAGDLNGDNIADMVAGAPQGGGECTSTALAGDVGGKVYVFFGAAGAAAPTGTVSASAASVTVVSGLGTNDQLGRRIAVGDVTGDGKDDLVLGARCADGPGDARLDSGEGYVLVGPLATGTTTLATTPPYATVYGADAGDELGIGPGVGDVTGDLVPDLILGAQKGDGPDNLRDAAGEVAVLKGPVAAGARDLGTSPADITIYSPDRDDLLGRFVAAGDVNGDGVADLAATAPFANGAVNTSAWNETGEVHVLTSLGAPPLPTVTVAASDASAAEAGPDPGAFSITRTGDTAADLTVTYAVGGTATNGIDYGTLSGTAVIPAGSTAVTLPVTPIDDSAAESPETVVLSLLSDPAYTVGAPASATVDLADNDGGLTCTITGTEGPDTLTGGTGADVICGLGGDDTISGAGGNDILLGGEGNDVLKGGGGDDVMKGEGGNDSAGDNSGADSFEGGSGDDRLNAKDTVANDTVDGGDGTDTCNVDVGDIVTNCP